MNNISVILIMFLVILLVFILLSKTSKPVVEKTRNVNVVRPARNPYYPYWDDSIFYNSYWWPYDSWRYRTWNGPMWRPRRHRHRRFY